MSDISLDKIQQIIEAQVIELLKQKRQLLAEKKRRLEAQKLNYAVQIKQEKQWLKAAKSLYANIEKHMLNAMIQPDAQAATAQKDRELACTVNLNATFITSLADPKLAEQIAELIQQCPSSLKKYFSEAGLANGLALAITPAFYGFCELYGKLQGRHLSGKNVEHRDSYNLMTKAGLVISFPKAAGKIGLTLNEAEFTTQSLKHFEKWAQDRTIDKNEEYCSLLNHLKSYSFMPLSTIIHSIITASNDNKTQTLQKIKLWNEFIQENISPHWTRHLAVSVAMIVLIASGAAATVLTAGIFPLLLAGAAVLGSLIIGVVAREAMKRHQGCFVTLKSFEEAQHSKPQIKHCNPPSFSLALASEKLDEEKSLQEQDPALSNASQAFMLFKNENGVRTAPLLPSLHAVVSPV